MIRNTLVWLLLLAMPAIAQKPEGRVKPPAMASPPEVRKTVDAITGTWSGQMTAYVPGAPAESFDWTMNCKSVALGSGALCTNTGKASIGAMAESCLLAYDPDGKAVHYMCVTSMGEVHDHKGKWISDKTIEFEPLRAGLMGQQITETLRWYFPNPNNIDKTSEVRLPDGNLMKFVFVGKRNGRILLKVGTKQTFQNTHEIKEKESNDETNSRGLSHRHTLLDYRRGGRCDRVLQESVWRNGTVSISRA